MKRTIPHNRITQPKDVNIGRGEKSQLTITDFLRPLEIQKVYPFNGLYRRMRQTLINGLFKKNNYKTEKLEL